MKRLLSRRKFLLATGLGITGFAAGGLYLTRQRWEYIVIHHSAGSFGNTDFLARVRRERQSASLINSMAYHFVIGNGNGMKIGEVAHDERWDCQLWGEHVSAKNMAFNLKGIGICLVGNFQEHKIPEKQYLAMINLTKNLMQQYRIPVKNVKTHKEINGERTLCPGKYFSVTRFNNDITCKNEKIKS